MDVTFEILANPPTHPLETPYLESIREARGDIIAAYRSASIATWNGSAYLLNEPITSPRTVFVHVTGVPDRNLRIARNLICSAYRDYDDKISTPRGAIRKARLWAMDTVNAPGRAQLLANKQATYTWTAARPYLLRKIDNRAITDNDVTRPLGDGFESGNLLAVDGGLCWDSTINMVSSLRARTGTRSLRFPFQGVPNDQDSWAEQRFELGENYSDAWFRFYCYFPNGTEGDGAAYFHRTQTSGANNKFFLVWSNSYPRGGILVGFNTIPNGSGGSNLIIVWNKDNVSRSSDGFPTVTNFIDSADLGRWMEVVVHFRQASALNVLDGAIEVWKNRVNVLRYTTWDSFSVFGNYYQHGYLWGYANSGFTNPTNIYVDDFEVSDINTFGVV